MFKNLLKKGKSKKGFTLIELIVVIAIIAILALILVPRFAGFTRSAADNTNNGNRRTIETAVQVMIADGRLGGTGTFVVDGDAANPTNVSAVAATITWAPAPVAPATVTTELQAGLRDLIGTNVRPAGTVNSYLVTVALDGVTVANN